MRKSRWPVWKSRPKLNSAICACASAPRRARARGNAHLSVEQRQRCGVLLRLCRQIEHADHAVPGTQCRGDFARTAAREQGAAAADAAQGPAAEPAEPVRQPGQSQRPALGSPRQKPGIESALAQQRPDPVAGAPMVGQQHAGARFGPHTAGDDVPGAPAPATQQGQVDVGMIDQAQQAKAVFPQFLVTVRTMQPCRGPRRLGRFPIQTVAARAAPEPGETERPGQQRRDAGSRYRPSASAAKRSARPNML